MRSEKGTNAMNQQTTQEPRPAGWGLWSRAERRAWDAYQAASRAAAEADERVVALADSATRAAFFEADAAAGAVLVAEAALVLARLTRLLPQHREVLAAVLDPEHATWRETPQEWD